MNFSRESKFTQKREAQKGVALILVVSLLAFLILIVTALSALLRVETQILNTAEKQAIARQNALNGLEIAISELQRYAGPDQRVTARGDLLGEADTIASPYLTGIWDTRDENSLPAWLISGNEVFDLRGISREPGPLTGAMYPSQYISPFTIIPDPDTSAQVIWLMDPPEEAEDPIPVSAVWAPRVPLFADNVPGRGGENRIIGHYAYWVGDEGVKASVSQPETFAENISTLLGAGWAAGSGGLANSEIRQISRRLPDRVHLSSLFQGGTSSSPFNPALSRFPWENLQAFAESRAFDPGLRSLPETFWQERRHHTTAISLGVLTNPHPTAGGSLKIDLSNNPEDFFRSAEAPAVTRFLNATNQQESLSFPVADRGNELTNSAFTTEPSRRGDFRRRYQIQPPLTSGRAVDSISPVLTEFYMIFTVRKANAGSDIIVRSRFYSTLWNPYSSALVPTDLHLDVGGLPEVTMILPFVPLGSEAGETVEIDIDLQEVMANATDQDGNPVYRVRLEFPPDGYPFPGYDAASWLPGRVYSWVGPNNAAGGGLITSEGQAQFYSNNINDGIWEQTIPDVSYPGPFARYPEFGLRGEASNLSIALLTETSTGTPLTATPLVQISPIQFDPFETADTAFGRTANTLQFGFRVRLAEAGDEGDSAWEKMQWFRANDPRQARPRHDHFDLSAPYFSPPNGPDPLLHTGTSVRRRDWLFDRTMGGTGKRPMEDIPLFERPGRSPLSVGSLQHLQLLNEEPLAIGNSWGGGLNQIFDHHFFSGKRNGTSYLFNGTRIPPNHRLIPVPGNDTEDESLPNAARYLVRGAFNVNSVSAQAWQANLLGSHLRTGNANSLNSFSYLNLYNRETGPDATRSGTVNSGTPLRTIGNDRFGVFARFANTLEETYFVGNVRQTGGVQSLRDQRRAEFFRRGMNALREGDGSTFDVSEQIVATLTENISSFARERGRPFYSLEEFLAPVGTLSVSGGTVPSGRPVSALEHALYSQENLYFFRADSVDRSGGTHGFQPPNNSPSRPIWPMTPAFTLQSDVMTSLAPYANVRSDTFLIRAYGDYTNPTTGRIEGRAWCEAVVQRIPQTVIGEDIISPDPDGPGRLFQIIAFRWLQENEL